MGPTSAFTSCLFFFSEGKEGGGGGRGEKEGSGEGGTKKTSAR